MLTGCRPVASSLIDDAQENVPGQQGKNWRRELFPERQPLSADDFPDGQRGREQQFKCATPPVLGKAAAGFGNDPYLKDGIDDQVGASDDIIIKKVLPSETSGTYAEE